MMFSVRQRVARGALTPPTSSTISPLGAFRKFRRQPGSRTAMVSFKGFCQFPWLRRRECPIQSRQRLHGFNDAAVGIGIHAHDLLLDFIGAVRQVDAVAERLRHLGFAVGSRQPHADRVFGQQNLRFDQRGTVYRVEFVDDFARLLDHRLLILACGYGRGFESRDVRRLTDRVGEESDGNALTLLGVALRVVLGEAAQLDFGLHGRVALQALYRDEVHIVERQLAQFGNLRLDEKRRFVRVETDRKVVEGDFDDVLAHLFGVVGVVGQRLRVGDHDEDAFEFARLLQFDAAAQRTYVVSQMKPARRTVAGKNDFSHKTINPPLDEFKLSMASGQLQRCGIRQARITASSMPVPHRNPAETPFLPVVSASRGTETAVKISAGSRFFGILWTNIRKSARAT